VQTDGLRLGAPRSVRHQQSIRFQYLCFDRMLLNAVVQTMQQPPMIVGFLDKYRQVPSITKADFREVSEDYHRFVGRLAATQRIPIVQPPKGVRRENWVEPFYQRFRRPLRHRGHSQESRERPSRSQLPDP